MNGYRFYRLIFTSLVAGELKCIITTKLRKNQKRSDFRGKEEHPQTGYPGLFLNEHSLQRAAENALTTAVKRIVNVGNSRKVSLDHSVQIGEAFTDVLVNTTR